jgi:hypothetical protein
MAGATLAGVWRRPEVIGPLTSHQRLFARQGRDSQSSQIASSPEVQSQEPALDICSYIVTHKVL